ncbi:hypothetical protein ACQPXH_31135 [Nocardia sp. CA-135953]|uniref:hypothetical protein n=1 Tax=Nocardia sp. CA-135953 TaxID=3239978 RepID=UPI003D995631
MPTPSEVLKWDIAGLAIAATNASQIADAIIKASNGMFTTVHDDLAWKGVAADAARSKAEREQTQMRAIATAYDDLSTACSNAHRDMEHPLAEIKTIFQHYAVAPIVVASDWSITGVDDWDSEAGKQLSRLSGLVSTLTAADAQWGAKITEANDELAQMAPASVLAAANTQIQQDKAKDDRADPERMRTSAAAFQQTFGRSPASSADWTTAEVLNPHSYDPKYKGVDPEIRVIKINPVDGQGVVRTGQYIQERDVSDPSLSNPAGRNKGDNRGPDINFDPEHTRVTTYVDYENGIVVVRQNPSVVQEADGSSGHVEVGKPEATVKQAADGSVRIKYDAADPIGAGGPTRQLGWSVNGDVVVTPTKDGAYIDGTRTNYPWMEAYQDYPDGRQQTIAVDPPTGVGTGSSFGPSINLQGHHDIGIGGQAFDDRWKSWNPHYDVKVETPGTSLGDPKNPPSVPVTPKPNYI